MTYTGAMVLPQNAVMMREEEMRYLEGGTAKMLCNNLKGLWNKSAAIRFAMKSTGITLSYIVNSAKCTYWWCVAKFGAGIVKAAVFLSRALAVALAVGTAAAVTYLWNRRVFY